MSDERLPPKPWEKEGPSPYPSGRPPKKHIKTMIGFLDSRADSFIKFDRKGTGVYGPDGEELSNGDAFLSSLWKQGLTDSHARALYDRLRTEAYDREAKYKEEVLDAAGFHRFRYLKEFIEREQKGRKQLDVLPDPRDVIIHGNGEVSIVGPVDAEGQMRLEKLLELRDLHIKTIVELMDWKEFSLEDRQQLYLSIRRRIYRFNLRTPPRLRKPVPRFRDLLDEPE